MKLVVGLGNPGPRYAGTRHNVGFRVVERFAASRGIALAELRFQGRFGAGRLGALDVGVLEPATFMNRSGDSLSEALGALPVEDPSRDLLVAFDDIDLPLGRLRLRPAGGAGGHRGLESVIDALGRHDFARLRFGVGRPPEGSDPVDYVLEPFSADEQVILDERIDAAARAVEAALAEGIEAAMNRFNREPQSELEREQDQAGEVG